MAPFVPVNDLERLLAQAATDPAARPAFYRAITEQELYIITEGNIPARNERTTSQRDSQFKVRSIEIDGKPHLPVFTSVDRISAVAPTNVGYAGMNGRVLLNALRGNDLVLNPGAAFGKVFLAHEVESILSGSIFAPQEEPDVGGKKILLGQPRDFPTHITEPLIRLFRKSRDVQAAYLAHAFIAELDEVPHTLIGLEISGDWQRVIEEAGVVVREVTKQGEIVDFVDLKPSVGDVIYDYMKRESKPFYKRKLFGLF